MIPQACKDGNAGNRNLYHFCLAMLIFLDIMVPITLVAIFILTSDFKTKTFLNKTLLGASTEQVPTSSTNSNSADSACCTLPVARGALLLGLVMFLIFVTIAGELGQDAKVFCNGYVRLPAPFFSLGFRFERTNFVLLISDSGKLMSSISSLDT